MQALYMYYNTDGQENLNITQLTRALDKNISKLYELYLYLLLFLEEVGEFALNYEEQVKARYIQSDKDTKSSLKLFQNPVLQKLINSEAFHKAAQKYHVQWHGDEDILRRIFQDLRNQDIYRDYVQLSEQNPVLQQEVLIFIIKHYANNLPLFHQHLEEEYYNWLDDKKIVLQMATKTIQTLASGSTADDFLQPLSQNEDDNYEYARDLLKYTVQDDKKLQDIITPRVTKWETHQIAVIDNIILKMALTEFFHFPSIPAKVSINEYIELAKNYSTPQSKKFINGVLDAILKDLKKEGTILKN